MFQPEALRVRDRLAIGAAGLCIVKLRPGTQAARVGTEGAFLEDLLAIERHGIGGPRRDTFGR